MKSLLEKALVHLLNEQHEKANELMHEFIVECAKEIHEEYRSDDEADLDNLDEMALEEEYFTEADLEDAETAKNISDDLDDTSVSDEDLTDDVDADTADIDADTADMDADVADVDADTSDMEDAEDADMDVDTSIEDKIDDIEDEIKALQAEFDKIMAELDDENHDADDMSVPSDNDMGEVSAEDEEDFDDLSESLVSDLKKVAASNKDGMGATGQKLSTPTESPIPTDKPSAGAIKTKNVVAHSTFEREKAPSSKSLPKYDNVRSKAVDGTSKMAPSGPKGAELAKPVAGNTKSPIPGKKK